MPIDDRIGEVDPVLLEATTQALVARLSDPKAKNDCMNIGGWWRLHPNLLSFTNVILSQIDDDARTSDAEKEVAVATMFFTLKVIGEYYDASDAEAVLGGLRLE